MYFQVKVQYLTEDDKGKMKKTTEYNLVEALSVTEAEGNMVRHLITMGERREYEIKSVSESKINELILTSQ